MEQQTIGKSNSLAGGMDIYCPHCGKEFDQGALFCAVCGTDLRPYGVSAGDRPVSVEGIHQSQADNDPPVSAGGDRAKSSVAEKIVTWLGTIAFIIPFLVILVIVLKDQAGIDLTALFTNKYSYDWDEPFHIENAAFRFDKIETGSQVNIIDDYYVVKPENSDNNASVIIGQIANTGNENIDLTKLNVELKFVNDSRMVKHAAQFKVVMREDIWKNDTSGRVVLAPGEQGVIYAGGAPPDGYSMETATLEAEAGFAGNDKPVTVALSIAG